MSADDQRELASLAVKIAVTAPRDGPFGHLARRLALCALAGAAGETLYWLRIASLAGIGPPALVKRAVVLARRAA
ncbi:MAG TPA: hypothetical protein VGF94_11790 [Kofleriaceae bacterium]